MLRSPTSFHRLLGRAAVLLAMVGVALPGSMAWGQTLTQAAQAAWARHPQGAAWAERQNEAQARLDQAQAWTPGPPSVSVSQLQDQWNQNKGRREWEVEVSTPLWLPAQRAARQGQARQEAGDLSARPLLARWQVAGDVREAWWAVAAARHALALAQARLDSAQGLQASVQRRFQAGDLARVDANLAQTERLAAQAEVVEAGQALAAAQQGYLVLTGQEAPQMLPPEAARAVAAPSASAWSDHPWVQAAQAAVNLAQSRLDVASATRREAPELAVRWLSERGDAAEPYRQAVGVKLTVPLSSAARWQQDSAGARAELVQAELDLARVQAQVQQESAQAQAALQNAEQLGRMAQERQALSEDNLQLAQRAFDLGESDLPTLLRARTAAHEAQALFKRQEVARHQAWSRVLQSQGVLP